MKNNKRFPVLTLITVFSLMVSLCTGILIMDKAQAASNQGSSNGKGSARKAAKMNSALSKRAKGPKADSDLVRVILQFDGQASSRVNSILGRRGIKVRGVYKNFNARVVELPASVLEELAAFDEVSYVSIDSEVKTLGHVSVTTGADAVRPQTKTGPPG